MSSVRQETMSTQTGSISQAVNLRGMQVRAGFGKEGLVKPMSWIQRTYPALTEDDKALLRRWLLGRAPATMPEALMRKAENALQRLRAA